jgi:hypothetical protein
MRRRRRERLARGSRQTTTFRKLPMQAPSGEEEDDVGEVGVSSQQSRDVRRRFLGRQVGHVKLRVMHDR